MKSMLVIGNELSYDFNLLSISNKKIAYPIQGDRQYCPNVDICKTNCNGTDTEKSSCR